MPLPHIFVAQHPLNGLRVAHGLRQVRVQHLLHLRVPAIGGQQQRGQRAAAAPAAGQVSGCGDGWVAQAQAARAWALWWLCLWGMHACVRALCLAVRSSDKLWIDSHHACGCKSYLQNPSKASSHSRGAVRVRVGMRACKGCVGLLSLQRSLFGCVCVFSHRLRPRFRPIICCVSSGVMGWWMGGQGGRSHARGCACARVSAYVYVCACASPAGHGGCPPTRPRTASRGGGRCSQHH